MFSQKNLCNNRKKCVSLRPKLNLFLINPFEVIQIHNLLIYNNKKM